MLVGSKRWENLNLGLAHQRDAVHLSVGKGQSIPDVFLQCHKKSGKALNFKFFMKKIAAIFILLSTFIYAEIPQNNTPYKDVFRYKVEDSDLEYAIDIIDSSPQESEIVFVQRESGWEYGIVQRKEIRTKKEQFENTIKSFFMYKIKILVSTNGVELPIFFVSRLPVNLEKVKRIPGYPKAYFKNGVVMSDIQKIIARKQLIKEEDARIRADLEAGREERGKAVKAWEKERKAREEATSSK